VAGLGEGVSADHLCAGDLGQISFLLLRGPEEHDGKASDPGLHPVGGHEAGNTRAQLLGNEHGTDLVQLRSTEHLGHVGTEKTQVSRLSEHFLQEIIIEFLDLLFLGQQLFGAEFLGSLCDLALIFGKVLGSKDLLRQPIRQIAFPCP
jgi:hypothetical protein